jgi:hypothetical protein
MQNRTSGSYRVTINRILIPVMRCEMEVMDGSRFYFCREGRCEVTCVHVAVTCQVSVEQYVSAKPDPVAPFSKPVAGHMNADHADATGESCITEMRILKKR